MKATLFKEMVRPSRFYSTEGRRSGTENRYHRRYIALIPITRYVDPRTPPNDEDPHSYAHIHNGGIYGK